MKFLTVLVLSLGVVAWGSYLDSHPQCPTEAASLCSDHVHCCPTGFECNLAHGFCQQGSAIALMARSVATKTSKMTVQQASELVLGFIDGLTTSLDLEDAIACEFSIASIIQNLENAVEQFKLQTPNSMTLAFLNLMDAYSSLDATVVTCDIAAQNDLRTLEVAFSTFKDPELLFNQITNFAFHNGLWIYESYEAAIRQAHDGSYSNLGYFAGELLGGVLYRDLQWTLKGSVVVDVFEVVDGLLEGFSEDLKLSDVEACITDTEKIASDLGNAVEQFEKKTSSAVAKGLVDIAEAFKLLPQDITACKSAATEEAAALEKVLAIFKNPASLAFHIGKSLIVNGKEIFGEIDTAVADWKSADFKGFGYNIGLAFGKLLGLDSEPISTPSYSDIGLAVKGVFKGLNFDVALIDIVACIGDVDYVIRDLVEATGSGKSFAGVSNSLKKMAEALETLPVAMFYCKFELVPQADQLQQAIDAFTNPETFVYNYDESIILNGAEIYQEYDLAILNYKKEDYEAFGYHLGVALGKVIPAQEDDGTNTPQEVAEILGGILTGLSVDLSEPDIQLCIADVSTIDTDIETGVEDIEKETLDSIKSGLAEISAGLSQIPTAIKTCKSGASESADELKKALTAFAHPLTFAYDVGKALVLNGKEIITEITTAVNDYKSGNFTGFGYNIGLALGKVISE